MYQHPFSFRKNWNPWKSFFINVCFCKRKIVWVFPGEGLGLIPASGNFLQTIEVFCPKCIIHPLNCRLNLQLNNVCCHSELTQTPLGYYNRYQWLIRGGGGGYGVMNFPLICDPHRLSLSLSIYIYSVWEPCRMTFILNTRTCIYLPPLARHPGTATRHDI